ncbi:MAG: DUF3090 domain-containing protein [Janthinobacterium lividum]
MPVFEFDPPQRFVVGTVGEPGARTFFLQARGAGRLTSVSLEKAQVAALAERVGELLDEIVRRSGGQAPVPALAAIGSQDNAPLDVPIEDEFRVGTMSLAWDGERDVVVIECFEVSETDADPELPVETDPLRNVLRVSLDGGTARAFAQRALALVAAGRPPCPFCSGPLDPAGHICPRANGYRR